MSMFLADSVAVSTLRRPVVTSGTMSIAYLTTVSSKVEPPTLARVSSSRSSDFVANPAAGPPRLVELRKLPRCSTMSKTLASASFPMTVSARPSSTATFSARSSRIAENSLYSNSKPTRSLVPLLVDKAVTKASFSGIPSPSGNCFLHLSATCLSLASDSTRLRPSSWSTPKHLASSRSTAPIMSSALTLPNCLSKKPTCIVWLLSSNVRANADARGVCGDETAGEFAALAARRGPFGVCGALRIPKSRSSSV